jgi:hypothetical protein
MNTLNLGSDDEPVVKKKSNTRNLKIALGLAAVILVPTIGSTLAGSIALNSAANIEFGQGFATTAACDNSMTIVPTSAVVDGVFYLSTVVVSGANEEACHGKFFTFRVMDSSTALVNIGGSSSTACKFLYDNVTAYATTSSTGGCVVSASVANGFTWTPDNDTRTAASDVEKITVESSAG